MKQLKNTENFTGSKEWKRLQPILITGLNAASTPLLSLAVSLLVVRLYGAILWGDFLEEFLWMNLAAHLISYGSKEMLLRSFSKEPAEAVENWQSSLKARLPFLLLFIMVLLWAPIGITHAGWILGWIFFRFIYQSFEPIIIFKRKFQYTIIAEIAGGIFLLASVYFTKQHISTLILLKYFMMAEFIKATLMALIQRRDFSLQLRLGLDFTQIKNATPFFLIGFAGLMHSRIDQLIATRYLPASQLAFYQIMMSILLMGQSVAYFIVQPYLKNLYRMSNDTIAKISLKLLITGSVLSPIIVLLGGILLHYFYHFDGDIILLIYGFLFVLPFFFTIPYIYALYKINEEKKVLIVNAVIILLNLICLPFLFSTQSIAMVLLFNAILQILQAIAYRLIVRSLI